MLRWEYVHDKGWRCYVLGRRLHHGLVGVVMAAAGLALAAHDRRDFPFRPDRRK